MVPSKFNLQVPLAERGEVFLMNTLSDAQLLVTPDVSSVLARIGRGDATFNDEEQETVDTLKENGFLVASYEEERRDLVKFFENLREDTSQLRMTVLTTLQCNFACDYCLQGDHGDHNLFAHKMSLETARELIAWAKERLDTLHPEKFVIAFFGGEPLLNIPVVRMIAEECHALCTERGVTQTMTLITNGLLLTPELVDSLTPFGLSRVKVTLDGDRETHDRMRPLRGRQGTFDRIIENVRRIAPKVPVLIGGNFDESSVDSYPALLDFLREQDFADKVIDITFKPIITFTQNQPKGVIPLTAVGASGKPLGGACMTAAGAGSSRKPSPGMCDSCNFAEEKVEFLRDETRKHGFPTVDGVHMGPCEIHRRHAYTVGVDGSLYACPGFGSEPTEAIGHINPTTQQQPFPAAERFERLSPLKEECGDCSFIPVCGSGCSVASNAELGDLHAPNCFKGAMESALVGLAQRVAASDTETLRSLTS